MKNNQSGFTLLEIITVIAIVGILAAISIPSFIQYRENSEIRSVARSILYTFRNVRALAVSQNRSIPATLNLDSHQMTYDSVSLNLPPHVKLEADDDITTLAETGTKSVTFGPQGTASSKFFIRVDGNPDLTIQLELSGLSKL